MTTGDNASVTLLSVLIDIISSEIVMRPNLKCFYWRDVVFTLTTVTVFPCFRLVRTVKLKLRFEKSNVMSAVVHAVLLLVILIIMKTDLVFQRSTTVDIECVIR